MTSIDLAALTAAQGTRILGPAPPLGGDVLAAAGDVNGDGIGDFLVSLGYDQVFLVHGRAGGYGATLNLGALDEGNGTRLSGFTRDPAQPFSFGWSVAGAGDVNGDGLADIVIAIPSATNDAALATAGYVYVVNGREGGLGSSLDLGLLTPDQGFRIDGSPRLPGVDPFFYSARFGVDVAGLGDVNGDGLADIGARSVRGLSYTSIVYGAEEREALTLTTAGLAAEQGLTWRSTGYVMAGVGDVNGDGRDDVLVSETGNAVLLFGQAGDWAPLDYNTLTPDRGIRILTSDPTATGAIGQSVAAAGDVNGDGIADMLVGGVTPWLGGGARGAFGPYASTPVWVVYGRAGGFTGDVDIATLTPAQGFRIVDSRTDEQIGPHFASAGDVNGDGLDDILVLATLSSGQFGSTGYVVHGQLGGPAGPVDLATLTEEQGFRIRLSTQPTMDFDTGPRLGVTLASAGDANGDGVADILVRMDDQPGNPQAYLLYGKAEAFDWAGTEGADSKAGTFLDDVLAGRGGSDLLRGNAGDDTLLGGGAGDTLEGGQGNDLLDGGAGIDLLKGGAGQDTLLAGAGGATLDGGTGADLMVGGAGVNIFVVDDAGDVIVEAPGSIGGVVASLSWTLSGNLILLRLTGEAAIDGTGNGAANVMDGNAAANRLRGWSGNDSLRGDGGDDTLRGDTDHDSLAGEAGDDRLLGGAGADTLDGGTGRDTVTGGGGADVFRFSTAPVAGEADRITDFARAEGDRIEISLGAFDPDGVTGLGFGSLAAQAGRFEANLSGAATSLQTRILHETDRGWLLFDMDGVGGAAAVGVAKLGGAPALEATDIWITA